MKNVKISKFEYDYLQRAVGQYEEESFEYQRKYWDEVDKNIQLQKKIGALEALFDKEADTDAIKYGGKLYRIVSTQHCKGDGEETLDICLVPVSEVG